MIGSLRLDASRTNLINPLNYPAMASPESLRLIEDRILQLVRSPGPIIDPYCGTGRMLAPFRCTGYDVVGMDCSPIAILAARVVHQGICKRRLRDDFCVLASEISAARVWLDVQDDESFWFRSESFVVLRNILQAVDLVASSSNVRRVFWLALVKAAREVSYIREAEYKLHRMHASMRSEHRPNVVASFLTHCRNLVDLLTSVDARPGRYRFVRGDVATASLKRGSFAAVVTSPPYGDSASTVGYGQFSRIPLLLLRYSTEFLKEYGCYEGVNLDGRCLGGTTCARVKGDVELPTSLPDDVGPPMARFSAGYFSRLALLSELLKRRATCCLVLGNRTHRGQVFPLIETTIECLGRLGFSLADRHDRLLSRKRLPRSMRHLSYGQPATHDSINYESVITMVRQ